MPGAVNEGSAGRLPGFFDVMVTDVPCSGFGVIGKKPEIRYKDRESLRGLPGIQEDIISNLADFVKPGSELCWVSSSYR